MTLEAKPRKPDRYEQLNVWPSRRPRGINLLCDYRTKTVYITDMGGSKMLAIPFDVFRATAEEIPS